MDNCASHRVPSIKELIRQAGVIVEWLPPYSPDLSLIEESFSVLKAWLKKYRKLADPFVGDWFGLFLYVTVIESDLKEKAINLFRSYGYDVKDNDSDVDYNDL